MSPGLPAVVLLAALIALPVHARDKHDPRLTTVGLQAQAEREVPNDQIVALVAAEENGKDPAALAASVNRKMAAALAAAREVPAVKARSDNYQTFPLYKEGRIESWRVSQQLRLESAGFAAMAQLIGRLQRELLVRGLSVGLSPEARRTAEDALTAEALAAFHARAALVRQALKAPGYRIRHIDVGASGSVVRPFAQEGMRATASSAPAAIEPGVSHVTVNVSGTIELAK